MKLITTHTLQAFEVHNLHMDRIPSSPEIPDPYGSCMAISGFLHDAHLINKRLASDRFTANTLEKLKENADEGCYLQLTARIRCYDWFQQVAVCLQEIGQLMNEETNTLRTHYDTPAGLFAELNNDIRNIRLCSFATLEKIRIDFAPTSVYQELSIDNSFHDEYMRIADRIDVLSATILNYKFSYPGEIALKNKKPWWRFW